MSTTYERIVPVLADAVGVEPEHISPDSHLLIDLGVDSLDMLDVTFRLEREFDVRLESEKLFPAWLFTNDGEFVVDGRLTDLGAARAVLEMTVGPVSAGAEATSVLKVRMLTGVIDKAIHMKSLAA